MRGQPRYTEKDILETLSPAELDSIHERVARSVALIWDGPDRKYQPLSTGICDFCQHAIPYEKRFRCLVLSNVLTGTCECADCFAKRRERELTEELMDEYMKAKKTALDIADFARL
jgi:hypothetical protein